MRTKLIKKENTHTVSLLTSIVQVIFTINLLFRERFKMNVHHNNSYFHKPSCTTQAYF